MATNIKHLNGTKYQKALTLEDCNSLANMLEKDPTTLSKEVKKRRITKDSFMFAI